MVKIFGAMVFIAFLAACATGTVGKAPQYKVLQTTGGKISSLGLIFVNPTVTADSDPARAQAYALSGVQDPKKLARAADRYAELFTLNGVPTSYVGGFDRNPDLKTVLSTSLAKFSHVLFFEPVGATLTTLSTRAQPIGSVQYRITLVDAQNRRVLEMLYPMGVNVSEGPLWAPTFGFDYNASRWYNTLASEQLVAALPADPKRPPPKTYELDAQEKK
jgi:hypothetical protein